MGTKKLMQESPALEQVTKKKSQLPKHLILHNDEIHSFDYVIDSLIEVCDHDLVQAEQCTYITHYNGKCDVKKGSYSFLKPFREGLSARGLSTTID